MLLKFVRYFLIFLLCSSSVAYAQTVSASGNQAQNAMGDLNTRLTVLKQQLAASQAEAAQMKTCMANHGFYSPADSMADSNGCIYEQDPQVGNLASNSLCTSDGNVVNCQPLSGSSVKVFTITQISSNHKTAIATCPNNALRVSCAGTRSYVAGSLMVDDCTESTCGILGIQPVGDNACRVTDGGTSSTPNPAAVAICLSLDGSGTSKVSGGAPVAVSCTLPWGGSLASGSNVTAWAASTVPYGQSCKSQSRTCNNGSLSGSYGYKTCSVQPAAKCTSQTVSWGNGVCMATVPTLSSGASTSVSGNPTETGPDILCHPGTAVVSCSNGSLSVSGSGCLCQQAGSGCFLPDVPVLMADGTSKPIAALKVGDKVRGKTRINTVLATTNFDVTGHLYGFNGSKPFVTGGHPFWTQDGWKAVDPSLTPKEHHNVKTTKLNVGDKLTLSNSKTMVITSIDSDKTMATHHVYNPQMGGDHTYFAHGYLVHNKARRQQDEDMR